MLLFLAIHGEIKEAEKLRVSQEQRISERDHEVSIRNVSDMDLSIMIMKNFPDFDCFRNNCVFRLGQKL